MKFHTRRATALAALVAHRRRGARPPAAATTAATAAPTAAATAAATLSMTMLPKNLGNPYFDTSTTGAEKAAEELGAEHRGGRPRHRQPRRAGAVHQHRRPAGRRRPHPVGQRPRRALRRDRRGARAPASRSSPSTPTPTPTAATCSSTRPPPRASRQAARADRRADRWRGRDRDPVGRGQRDQPERLDRHDEEGARRQPDYTDIKLVDTVYGDDDDQKSFDQTAALLQNHPDLKGIISPTTVGIAAAARYLSDSESKGKVALTGLGTPNQMRDYVKDGTVKSFALWNPRTSATWPPTPRPRSPTATSPARRATPSRPATSASSGRRRRRRPARRAVHLQRRQHRRLRLLSRRHVPGRRPSRAGPGSHPPRVGRAARHAAPDLPPEGACHAARLLPAPGPPGPASTSTASATPPCGPRCSTPCRHRLAQLLALPARRRAAGRLRRDAATSRPPRRAWRRTEVNARWQAEMAEFFVDLDGRARRGLPGSSTRSSTSRTSSPPAPPQHDTDDPRQ